MHDATVTRRWPDILPLLDQHGLEARYVEADDESVDAAIEIRQAGGGEDDDMGDIQFCGRSQFCGNNWTNAARDTRRHGGVRKTVLKACEDLLENLRRDGMI